MRVWGLMEGVHLIFREREREHKPQGFHQGGRECSCVVNNCGFCFMSTPSSMRTLTLKIFFYWMEFDFYFMAVRFGGSDYGLHLFWVK